ncbi:MAG: lmo0937 family membrane protein [Hymenobacter sp.]|nr:lmo0937 family membrane protein [Hymenobacter sp.]
MGNLLYIIAVVLILIWALGFFGVLGAGIGGNNLIHILLVIAIIAILLRVIRGGRVV